jgi:hypothetical protein
MLEEVRKIRNRRKRSVDGDSSNSKEELQQEWHYAAH